MPVVFVATKGANYEKVVSNVQKKARKGKIIALASHQDPHLESVDHIIRVPETLECLSPLLNTVPPTAELPYCGIEGM